MPEESRFKNDATNSLNSNTPASSSSNFFSYKFGDTPSSSSFTGASEFDTALAGMASSINGSINMDSINSMNGRNETSSGRIDGSDLDMKPIMTTAQQHSTPNFGDFASIDPTVSHLTSQFGPPSLDDSKASHNDSSGLDALGLSGNSLADGDETAPRKRHRKRKPINCSFCRRRKLKCDRKQPCSNCVKRNLQSNCFYATEPSIGGVPMSFLSSSTNSLSNSTESRDAGVTDPALTPGSFISNFTFGTTPIPSPMPMSMSTTFNTTVRNTAESMPQNLYDDHGNGNLTSRNTNNNNNGFTSSGNNSNSNDSSSKFSSSGNPESPFANNQLMNLFLNGTNPDFLENTNQLSNKPNRNDGDINNDTSSGSSTDTDKKSSFSPLASFKDSLLPVGLSNWGSQIPRSGYQGYANGTQRYSSSSNSSLPHASPANSDSGPSTGSTNGSSVYPISSPNFPPNRASLITPGLYSGGLHLRNGRSTGGSSVSVNSLAALFTPSETVSDTYSNAGLSTSSSRSEKSKSVDNRTLELQQRLETMERMLITLVRQTQDGGNTTSRNSPLSNNSSPADSNASNTSNASMNSRTTDAPRGVKSSPAKPQRVVSSLNVPPTPQADDDTMTTLRESLGMLKLDTSGKAIYHGDTHWGSLVSELDAVRHIIGKLKSDSELLERDIQKVDNPSSQDVPRSQSPPNEGGGIGAPNNPAPSTTGGCFRDNSFFASLQSSDSYMKVLETVPGREQCDILIDRYFDSINTMFPIVNRTTFDAEYDAFWTDPPSTDMAWMALFLAMLCLGLQSYVTNLIGVKLPDLDDASQPSATNGRREPTLEEVKSVFPEAFRENPEQAWLIWLEGAEYYVNSWKLNFKPSLTNIRAMFVLMLCQHPSSFDYDWLDQSWIDISIIIRIAQTMGMHRDPQWFSIDEYEREERRRIWYLLQYFDLYLTITHGLPTIIRQGTMDVMSPAHANLSDVAKRCRYFEEFDPLNPLPKDSIDSSSSDYLNNDRHKNIRFIPVKSEPFTVRTDVSFSLARSKLSMMGVWIYTETTNLQTPNMSYEKILELDYKLRMCYNESSAYLRESVLEDGVTKSSISGHSSASTHSSSSSSSSPESIQNKPGMDDQAAVLFERFLYQLDYLRIIMVLHRKYSSRGLDNLKYRRSREETVHSAEQILKLHEWFCRSPAADPLRSRFSFIVVKLLSPVFIHSIILLSLYSIGNFNSYSFHAANNILQRIEINCSLCVEIANKTRDPFVSRHLHFLLVLFRESKSVFNMSPSEREELKRQRQERKRHNENGQLMTNDSNNLNPLSQEKREQYAGVPSMINVGYHSDYNTFVYSSWDYDRIKTLINSFKENPDQFYDEWKMDSFMSVDDDMMADLNQIT